MNHKKVIKGRCLEDEVGPYIPYCTFEIHEGIVRYSQYRICEKKNCDRYVKFRPEEREDARD